MDNLKKQIMDKWQRFSDAFDRLGDETYGMTAVAAAVLFEAYVSFRQDGESGGYQSLQAGVHPYAFHTGATMVDLLSDFSGCRLFWKFEMDIPRARITEDGIKYVEDHIAVFETLRAPED